MICFDLIGSFFFAVFFVVFPLNRQTWQFDWFLFPPFLFLFLLNRQTSRGVMQGLPILEQEIGLGGEAGAGAGGGGGNGGVSSGTGWGLGGSGPILKTQTIVSYKTYSGLV